MKLRLGGVPLLLALGIFGCAGKPVLPLMVPGRFAHAVAGDQQEPASGGHVIVAGNRGLTAAHVAFPRGSSAKPEILILPYGFSPRWRSIGRVMHGDLDSVAQLEEKPWRSYEPLLEDWAAFEFDSGTTWFVNMPLIAPTRPVRLGEKLSVVRALEMELANGARLLGMHPTQFAVVDVMFEGEDQLPDGIIALLPTEDFLHEPSPSGSFVGRWHTRAQAWELVGIMVASIEVEQEAERQAEQEAGCGHQQIYLAMTPPEEAVRWLLEGQLPAAGEQTEP